MAEMKSIVEAAMKRRAKYLAEFERLGWTIAKFAVKHKLTTSRMSLILKKAKEDIQ